MVDYRDILRLHHLGNSQCSSTLKVHSSRNTVRTVIVAAKVYRSILALSDDITNGDTTPDFRCLPFNYRTHKNCVELILGISALFSCIIWENIGLALLFYQLLVSVASGFCSNE